MTKVMISNPIAAAVAPLKDEAVKRAVEMTSAEIEKVVALNAVGTNLLEMYKRAHGNMSRREYFSARERWSFVTSCVSYKSADWPHNAPCIVTGRNDEGIARLMEEAAREAAASFDAYVAKLTGKVGECDAAKIDGRSLWQGSTLTVTKGDKVERWHTQQIINVSCLGKVFNQWPTRLLKH